MQVWTIKCDKQVAVLWSEAFMPMLDTLNPRPLKGSLSAHPHTMSFIFLPHWWVQSLVRLSVQLSIHLLRAPLLILSFVPWLLEAIFSHAWVTGKAKLTSTHFDLHCHCPYCPHHCKQATQSVFEYKYTWKYKDMCAYLTDHQSSTWQIKFQKTSKNANTIFVTTIY